LVRPVSVNVGLVVVFPAKSAYPVPLVMDRWTL
jgi:hypothetical protein